MGDYNDFNVNDFHKENSIGVSPTLDQTLLYLLIVILLLLFTNVYVSINL